MSPCVPSAAMFCIATSLSAQAAPQPFLPFSDRAYRIVNSVAWTPDGDSMLVALFYREVRAHRSERSDTTMPELGLYVTTRSGDRWTEPTLLPVSGRYPDYEPALLADGTVLVFKGPRGQKLRRSQGHYSDLGTLGPSDLRTFGP